jgi:hypothetical protein
MNVNRALLLSFAVLLASACAAEEDEPTDEVESAEEALKQAPWQPIHRGLPAPDAGARAVSSIAMDYHLPSLVYAATSEGMYQSADLGQHWHSSPSGDPDGGTMVIVASDPNQFGSAYAGAVFPNQTTRDAVLYSTRTGGASWSSALRLPGGYIETLVVTPGDAGVVYAGWFGHNFWGLVRSADRGATWTSVNVEGGAPCCHSLVATSPKHVFGLTFFGDNLVQTTDGEDWHLVNSDLSFREIAIDRRLPDIIYGADARSPGLLKSTDGGHSWFAPSAQLADAQVEHVSISSVDGRLFTLVREADRVAVYVSIDGGRVFQPATGGLANEVYHVEPHPMLPCIAIALTGGGVYRTLSAGGTCR